MGTHLVYDCLDGRYVGCTRLDLSDREENMKRMPGHWLVSAGINVETLKLNPLIDRRVTWLS